MANTPRQHHEDPEEIKIFSENLEKFLEALECLYVFDNLGGRLQFLEQYPQAAHYIFPAELIHFDQIGTKDKTLKAKLEQEADQNLSRFLTNIRTIQEKEKSDKALEPEDIRTLIENVGREISLHIFDITIVDRFAPAKKEPEPEPEKTLNLQPITTPSPNTTSENISPINLGRKLILVDTNTQKSKPLSYQDILNETEQAQTNPQKNRYTSLFNISAKS